MIWLILACSFLLLFLSMKCAKRGHHVTYIVSIVVVFVVNLALFADIMRKMGHALGVL
ncbi:hypothetical protein CPTMiller_00126 [Citrobacter phage Miller]|uniref:Uncharacterized protein n=1 Tax=Citrobacter phage Miller TaxID=1527524 RepID=A0A076YJU7_9CAUD|nr:hypothetical protein CPTMiller_00126 [Citrobacter phage Miller]AIK68062.1 hypothetical protein CPTMiller_00126 [Citrobacter phage Miller]